VLSRLNQVNVFIGTLTLSLVEIYTLLIKDNLAVKRVFFSTFLDNLRKIVWSCLPISLLTVSTSAIVYSFHIAPEFYTRGLSVYLGGIVALALIREGAPVMGALAIVTQYCSGMTAQIASMKVTEQLDAMKLAKANPVIYLLFPMICSGIVGFPLVIAICILVSILVNYLTSNLLINVTYQVYTTSIFNAVVIKDLLLVLVKSSIFGFVSTLVSFTCGILTVGGSKSVGNSTRLSVIINFALVVILDYIITALWL